MPSGLRLTEVSAASIPTPGTNTATLFLNSATGVPCLKDDTGTVTPLYGVASVNGATGVVTNPDLQGTGLTSNEVGFRNIPQNSQSAAYTIVAADSGKHIYHPSTDANARTFTLPENGSVAFPIGTAITFINETSQVVSIAITTDTLVLAGTGTTGTRSLAQYGVATAVKVTSTRWIISGTGIT